MAKNSLNPALKVEPSNNPDTESEGDEVFEDSDNVSAEIAVEQDLINRDVRRKIEIYWEKKRLREQFEDFDETEFGF
jgi:hypothetical protein